MHQGPGMETAPGEALWLLQLSRKVPKPLKPIDKSFPNIGAEG